MTLRKSCERLCSRIYARNLYVYVCLSEKCRTWLKESQSTPHENQQIPDVPYHVVESAARACCADHDCQA